jgi:hypothetical protein
MWYAVQDNPTIVSLCAINVIGYGKHRLVCTAVIPERGTSKVFAENLCIDNEQIGHQTLLLSSPSTTSSLYRFVFFLLQRT